MLTAHLPAGYSLVRLARQTSPSVLAVALIFSILPDFDLLWFYLVDNRSIHHHRYWVHLPVFWVAVFCPLIALGWRTRFRAHLVIAFAAVMLHLVLDTIAGGIAWLAPFDRTLIHLVIVPPSEHYHWLMTFMLHWTFALELVVWCLALGLMAREVSLRRQAV